MAGSQPGVRALFAGALATDTLLLWVIFVTNVFVSYAFFGWLPTALTSTGLTLPQSLHAAFMFNAGCMVGPLTTAGLMRRTGSRATLGVLAFCTVAAVAGLISLSRAAAGQPSATLDLGLAVAGFALSGVQIGMYSVAAHVYPTALRATGVGWALGIGRLGGVCSGFGGGLLLGVGPGLAGYFGGMAAVSMLTGLAIVTLAGHVPAAERARTLALRDDVP